MKTRKRITRRDAEARVLEWLVKSDRRSGEDFYPFRAIMRGTRLTRPEVRRACRALARKGLAEYERALVNEMTGRFAGAGYRATTKALDLAAGKPVFQRMAEAGYFDQPA